MNKTDFSSILLLAKQSGKTSFASLSAVKRALKTNKVGHTGTLDSFADGLLVVLTGKLTRLASYISAFDKEYFALIEFGTETDTLDPTGKITKTGFIPNKNEVLLAIEKFNGKTINQIPPLYSAIHVKGKRASDIARKTEDSENHSLKSAEPIQLAPRKITIHSIELIDFFEKYALIKVKCSKGTYVRSLARDIAGECATFAHLKALRRISVGSFQLQDAAGFSLLPDFSMQNLIKNKKTNDESFVEPQSAIETEIKTSAQKINIQLAERCGFIPVYLAQSFVDSFANGKKISEKEFYSRQKIADKSKIAVFYDFGFAIKNRDSEENDFAGIVSKQNRKISYDFVITPKKKFALFSWEQIVSGRFSKTFKEKGTAVTVGSFDGIHLGHRALFSRCLSQTENLACGVITFSRSLSDFKSALKTRANNSDNQCENEKFGDISTLSQKIDCFRSLGFDFAAVIDFSPDFSRMSGDDFLSILADFCGMKFIAEGDDFRCGHKGAFDCAAVKSFCQSRNIDFYTVSRVDYLGSRISSSRIKSDILSGNFDSANHMLSNPFSLDCAGFEWNRKITKNGLYLETKKQGVQIFPPDGEYNVKLLISGSEGVSVTKDAVCKSNSAELRLSVFDGSPQDFVKAIQFC